MDTIGTKEDKRYSRRQKRYKRNGYVCVRIREGLATNATHSLNSAEKGTPRGEGIP